MYENFDIFFFFYATLLFGVEIWSSGVYWARLVYAHVTMCKRHQQSAIKSVVDENICYSYYLLLGNFSSLEKRQVYIFRVGSGQVSPLVNRLLYELISDDDIMCPCVESL